MKKILLLLLIPLFLGVSCSSLVQRSGDESKTVTNKTQSDSKSKCEKLAQSDETPSYFQSLNNQKLKHIYNEELKACLTLSIADPATGFHLQLTNWANSEILILYDSWDSTKSTYAALNKRGECPAGQTIEHLSYLVKGQKTMEGTGGCGSELQPKLLEMLRGYGFNIDATDIK